ncbi:putative AAA+ superfamily ATPase [Actinocrispum wychmicini]|uniref:Putative AAA+ superfamily ATPase n=1 Tax=Actinocrispum wychmicini TaxID=1213861 RepID=A0A4R2JWG3_9PSEU|nr:putative AAA+ superfamily ATPase [Actinocrispum wychmicini]
MGKSVTMKDAASVLCGREDVDPRQIVYLPADGMRAKDLRRALVLGRDVTRSVDRNGARPRIWLLDEVTGIEDWTAALKYLRDNTLVGDDTVVCTGSSWSDTADVERDLLAGRAGNGACRRTRLLLPMRFRDVLAATRPELARPGPLPPWGLQSAEARAVADDLELHVDDLDLAWQSYLTSGGFPRAVAEHAKEGMVSQSFMEDLAAWLHRDVDHDAPPDSIPRLLAELQHRSTSPLNRRSTAEQLGYPSAQTFDVRLSRLMHSFAGLWCHQIGDAGTRISGAQSKFYLTDPLLAWLGHRLRAGLPQPAMPSLTEMALASALAVTIDDIEPGRWMSGDTIGYVRTGAGNEVDLGPVPVPVAGQVVRTTPLEAKWVSHGWRTEARVVEGKYGGGVLATKNITDTGPSTWAIPAPVVALMLN